MLQRTCNSYTRRRAPTRPRIVIEDDRLDLATLDLTPPGSSAFDIVVCNGPGEDACPLVVEGTCPAGHPDAVVPALDPAGPWTDSVRSAWEQAGVRIARIDDRASLVWPAHVGAGIRAYFRTERV
jgi:hypothetical protein